MDPHATNKEFTIRQESAGDAPEVAAMVGELLDEIMCAIDFRAFDFDLVATTSRLLDFLDREKYFGCVAPAMTRKLSGSSHCMKATRFTQKALSEP